MFSFFYNCFVNFTCVLHRWPFTFSHTKDGRTRACMITSNTLLTGGLFSYASSFFCAVSFHWEGRVKLRLLTLQVKWWNLTFVEGRWGKVVVKYGCFLCDSALMDQRLPFAVTNQSRFGSKGTRILQYDDIRRILWQKQHKKYVEFKWGCGKKGSQWSHTVSRNNNRDAQCCQYFWKPGVLTICTKFHQNGGDDGFSKVKIYIFSQCHTEISACEN